MDLDWTGLISAGSGVGTLISSLIALFTLREMRAQRKHSYKPELMVPEVCFNYTNEFPNYVRMWTTDDKEFLKLKIHNVGLGVAKNIKFEWTYDIERMVERFYLLRAYDDHEINVDIHNDRITHSESGKTMSGGGIASDNKTLDFMLAAEANTDGYFLELPGTYITISSAIYKYSNPNKIFTLTDFSAGLEPLTLKISYEDISGNLVRKSFNVEIKFFLRSINRNTPASEHINTMRGRIYISAK